MNEVLAKIDRETMSRFAKFIIVGVFNTAFGYTVYAALVLVGLAPQWALVIAFSVGVIWNYFTTARLVFQVKGFGRLPGYVAVCLSVYATNAVVLAAAEQIGLPPLLAQAPLTLMTAIMMFVGLSFVLRPDEID